VQEALASELPSTLFWFFAVRTAQLLSIMHLTVYQHCEVVDFSEETLQIGEQPFENGQLVTETPRPQISIQVVTALLATLLVSLRSNVATAARHSVVNLIGQLSESSVDHVTIPPPVRRMVYQELLLQVVIGVGKLDLLNTFIVEDDPNSITRGRSDTSHSLRTDHNSDSYVDPTSNEPSEMQNIPGVLQTAVDSPRGASPDNIPFDPKAEDESHPAAATLSSGLSETSDMEGISSASGFQSDEIKVGRFSAMSMIATITAGGT
jgi:hypothetical protein